MRRLVIDTDAGVDDAVALWWALTHPEVEVVALVATWGNVDLPDAVANLARILHASGHPEVPIAVGAGDPIGLTPLMHRAPEVHGRDGLGGHAHRWPTGGIEPVDEPATEMLARLGAEQSGHIDLVTIGPLSTLAEALAAHPELVQDYRSLTVMGGSVLSGGNALPAGEANIAHDPEAAARVVTAGWTTEEPPLLVGLDATMAALLSVDEDLAAARASDTVAARFIADPMVGYAEFYASTRQTPAGTFPCHDLLAVMAAAGRPVITEAPVLPLAVDTGGSAAWGATVADRRVVAQHTIPGFAPWRVALGVDADVFRAGLRSLL